MWALKQKNSLQVTRGYTSKPAQKSKGRNEHTGTQMTAPSPKRSLLPHEDTSDIGLSCQKPYFSFSTCF